jgi:UrcA family protein
MKHPAIAAVALAGTLFAIQPALASAQETESMAVTYDDLDLTSDEGREQLDRRIDKAAEKVCGADEATVGSRIRSRETRQCIRQAKRDIERNLAAIIEDNRAGG